MAHRVVFAEKNGSQGSRLFPSLVLAENFARSVRFAKVEPGGKDEVSEAKVLVIGGVKEGAAIKRELARQAALDTKLAALASGDLSYILANYQMLDAVETTLAAPSRADRPLVKLDRSTRAKRR